MNAQLIGCFTVQYTQFNFNSEFSKSFPHSFADTYVCFQFVISVILFLLCWATPEIGRKCYTLFLPPVQADKCPCWFLFVSEDSKVFVYIRDVKEKRDHQLLDVEGALTAICVLCRWKMGVHRDQKCCPSCITLWCWS